MASLLVQDDLRQRRCEASPQILVQSETTSACACYPSMLKALTAAPLLILLLIAPGVRAQSLDAIRAKLHGNTLQFAAVVIRSSQNFDALQDSGCPTSAEFNFTERNTQQELESMVPSSFASDFSAAIRREMDIHRAETQDSARGRVNGLVQKGFSKSVACLSQMYTTRAILVTARESFGLTAEALQFAEGSKDLDGARTRLEDGLSHLGGWAVASVQRFEALRGDGCPTSADANLTEEDIERELESMLPSPSLFASAFSSSVRRAADTSRAMMQKITRDQQNEAVQQGANKTIVCVIEMSSYKTAARQAREDFKMTADALRLVAPP